MAGTHYGGYGPTENATEETQKLCDQVKSHLKYEEFIAVVYRVQVVVGRNFLIKVHVGGTSYIHLLVFEALPHDGGQVTLMWVLMNQTKDAPLEPFN